MAKKQFGWLLLVLFAARVYYENGMSSSGSATTNSLLAALDFGGPSTGPGSGISFGTGLIGAAGVWLVIKK